MITEINLPLPVCLTIKQQNPRGDGLNVGTVCRKIVLPDGISIDVGEDGTLYVTLSGRLSVKTWKEMNEENDE